MSFEAQVLERDRSLCRLCGSTRELGVHIIGHLFNLEGGRVLQNAITLCAGHCLPLARAKVRFIAGARPGAWEDIGERVLYARIDSSFAAALRAAAQLTGEPLPDVD